MSQGFSIYLRALSWYNRKIYPNALPENLETLGQENPEEGVEFSPGIEQRLQALRSSIEVSSIRAEVDDPVRERFRELSEKEFLSTNPRDRIRAARHGPHLWNLDLFEDLFRDPDPRVRCQLLKNSSLDRRFPSLHERLYRDPDSSVRAAAAEKFMLLLHRPDLVEQFLRDPATDVRAGIAKVWNRSFGFSDLAALLLVDSSRRIQDSIRENPWIDHDLKIATKLGSLLSFLTPVTR